MADLCRGKAVKGKKCGGDYGNMSKVCKKRVIMVEEWRMEGVGRDAEMDYFIIMSDVCLDLYSCFLLV